MNELAVAIQNENENVSILETIESIKNAGFKNVFVQWYNEEGQYSQEGQLEYARKQGLNIIFAHLGYQNINDIWENDIKGDLLVDRYKDDIKICKQNNISLVIMHLTSKDKAPMYNEIGLRRIKEIVDYARQLDVNIAFENTKIKGYLEYVLGNIKDDNVGICFDAGHYHVHFNDEFDFEFFKNRIFAVHLHDNDKSDDLHLLPFDGTIDWETVITKLKECNYEGPITLEICYGDKYSNIKLDEFYEIGKDRGNKLIKIAEKV